MSYIARMLTAVVLMLSLVCLTMPGPAAADIACTHVYVTMQVSSGAVDAMMRKCQENGDQCSYDPTTHSFYEYENVNLPGCRGTSYTYRDAGPGPGGGPNTSPARHSAPNLTITGGQGSGQTGGSSTHQTTGSGSTAGGPKTKRPTTQTAPSR